MLSALENHITKVMTHFGDSCYAWDVANEVMGDNAQMRESFWYTTTGMEFLQTAFKTANSVKKSLGLKTKLYYNDYNTNVVNPKSTAVLNMIKGLPDAGITVDGVGFQSHFGFSDQASASEQVENYERFTALGLEIALTELDVTASSSSPSSDEQAQQPNVYKNTISTCKQVEKCVGVTIWGYDDNYSWLSTKAPRRLRDIVRPNGAPRCTGVFICRAAAAAGASPTFHDTVIQRLAHQFRVRSAGLIPRRTEQDKHARF
ncbi:unnamed protein product [Phytophthora lilii]|uniref:endo-1,4-beta-xylanase n=1 Tax=Phytophthora lilii TaxID=2077276 RepID=A0A9W6WYS0_9STRA|nr:unnamed protein product [Phytophthora lilii]